MAAIKATGNTEAAFRSGTPYHDASPVTPVTADSLMGTCWRCSWAARRGEDGKPVWHLKAVHAACPEHKELSHGHQVYGPRLASGNGGQRPGRPVHPRASPPRR